jgi:serine/threonine-protein kinase
VVIGLERRARMVAAREAQRVEAISAKLTTILHARDPGLRDAAVGDVAIAPSLVSDALDDVVRRMLGGDPGAEAAARAFDALARTAQPGQLAEAMLILPLRNSTVGVTLTPDLVGSRLEVDLRGELYLAATLPVEVADVVAARLATHAGLDLASERERIGRLTARLPGATGDLVVAYRTAPGGASAEVRRLMSSADATTTTAVPDQLGPYRVLAVLDQGGMGVVYRAMHTVLQRPAAVKILRSGYLDDPIATGRFMREARAAARAHHPNIVETYDYGQLPDGRPYLIMELVNAGTLKAMIKRGALEPLAAVLVARELAVALDCAHRAGVIHRDLKPANVFVDDQLNVKLADFGAARIVDLPDDGITRPGVVVGTPTYMSPEHITGASVDGRTDLYALGCVLFEMLSGKPPYRGESMRSVLTQHIQAAIPTVASPHGALSPALVRLVRKLMAKDPRQRHASADQVIADLDFAADELSRDRGARRP